MIKQNKQKNEREDSIMGKLKAKKALTIWLPTGNRDEKTFYSVMRIVVHPAFLMIVTVALVVLMTHFRLTSITAMWIASISTGCACVVSILVRRKIKNRSYVPVGLAKKINNFWYIITVMCSHKIYNIVNDEIKRTENDILSSSLFLSQLYETIIKLKLYEKTGRTKINIFTGKEYRQVYPLEIHVDFTVSNGLGYVLLKPSEILKSKIDLIDEFIIIKVLRDIGYKEWIATRVETSDCVILYALKDESISPAYDLTSEGAE